jgi:eukaryotic-like serine/threonine-protein kinase
MSSPGQPSEFPPAPSSVPLPGVKLGGVIDGKYRVERIVGRGGMGLVVAATHLQLGRTVAIKLIREEYVEDPGVVERLVREARAVASIQSEHVARVLDVGTLDNGAPFIVMEYLEGQDLDSLLQSDGPLQISEAVDFMLQACEAIAEAHFNHIVHRDLKPANLFVAHQPGGVRCVKVVDFGISKLMDLGTAEPLTDPSRMMGSLYHMAPEQISGDPVDVRTDVWALGVLLYEMLTGRKPFRPGAWPAVCNQIVNESAPDLESMEEGVPAELRFAIRRCLRRAPAERYDNVAELAMEITPFGSRRARHSLERIVRLATTTGDLSPETLLPATPPPRLRSSDDSQSPVSSDPLPRPPTPHGLPQRRLWALGLLLGCGLVLLMVAQLSDRGPASASLSVAQLTPVSDPGAAGAPSSSASNPGAAGAPASAQSTLPVPEGSSIEPPVVGKPAGAPGAGGEAGVGGASASERASEPAVADVPSPRGGLTIDKSSKSEPAKAEGIAPQVVVPQVVVPQVVAPPVTARPGSQASTPPGGNPPGPSPPPGTEPTRPRPAQGNSWDLNDVGYR